MEKTKHYLKAGSDSSGIRLDKYITANIQEITRSRVQGLIEKGCIEKGGVRLQDCSYKVKAGDSFEITIPEVEQTEIKPAEIPLNIIYEDNDLLVIDKPAGLTVHPGAGNHSDTMVNALLSHCGKTLSGIGGVARPGIVHRLDKDTSGLLVVAKNDKSHLSLSKQIQTRELKRTYIAIVWEVPNPPAGKVSANIARSKKNRKKMAVFRESGKPATTNYKTIERYGNNIASMVECRLETGRTHQIRVHMNHIGNSLIGDKTYGSNKAKSLSAMPIEIRDFIKNFSRQALHSIKISFAHPSTGKTFEFESKIPEDISTLASLLKQC